VDISRATTTTLNRFSSPHLRSTTSATRPLVSRAASPIVAQDWQAQLPDDVVVASLPSEAQVLHLFDLYFSDTGLLFPYISETHVRSGYEALKRQNFTTISRPFLGLLSAIFAVATLVVADPTHTISQNTAKSDVYFQRGLRLASECVWHTPDIETGMCHSLPLTKQSDTLSTIPASIVPVLPGHSASR
jgi:hypothetical protein